MNLEVRIYMRFIIIVPLLFVLAKGIYYNFKNYNIVSTSMSLSTFFMICGACDTFDVNNIRKSFIYLTLAVVFALMTAISEKLNISNQNRKKLLVFITTISLIGVAVILSNREFFIAHKVLVLWDCSTGLLAGINWLFYENKNANNEIKNNRGYNGYKNDGRTGE